MTSLFFPLPFGDIVALSSGFYFSFEKIVISLIDVPLKVMSQFSLDALKTLVCRNFTVMSLIVSSFVLIQLGISSTSLISFISFGEKNLSYYFFHILLLHYYLSPFLLWLVLRTLDLFSVFYISLMWLSSFFNLLLSVLQSECFNWFIIQLKNPPLLCPMYD